MSPSRKTLSVMAFLAAGAVSAMVALPASASADTDVRSLVHASPGNACKLNVRTEPDLAGTALTTLTCANYTTCEHHAVDGAPCGPPVVGGTYTCVGADGSQAVDNRWAAVAWRSPEPAYVALACAEFRD